MERSEQIKKVKNDLKRMRILTHSIDSATKAEKKHENRILYIRRSRGEEQEKEKRIENLHKLIDDLKIDELVNEFCELEATYMTAINELESIDKAILLDSLFNGLTYREIGNRIGYSERGIQKRMTDIFEKLTNLQ